MSDSFTFTVDVVKTIGERLAKKTAELGYLINANASLKEWFVLEAFLACKQRQASYPFCEVLAKPTYASEGVPDDGTSGDLRVGGPDDGANHCWAFMEFAFIDDANHASATTAAELTAATERLKRLGWKKSAALLVIVAVSQGDVPMYWDDAMASCDVLHQPLFKTPLLLCIPSGGLIALHVFDCKRKPSDVLTAQDR